MDEIKEVGHCRAETLDRERIDLANRLDNGLGGVATVASMQKARECALIFGVFVDVRNAQLRLPEKRMVRPFENLALFGNRSDHRLQR